MTWHSTTYRLPDDAIRGNCERTINDKNLEPCTNRGVYGFTSIDKYGSYRYSTRCEHCAVHLCERLGIKMAGERECIIFPIPASAAPGECSSCSCAIRWIITSRGNRMPVDSNGVSHFVTCFGASAHRKRA